MKSSRLFAGVLMLASFVYLGASFTELAYAAETKGDTKAAATKKKEAGFVASSQSKTYHVPTCGIAKNIKPENLVKFATKAEATKAGYKACKICIDKDKK